MFPGESTVTNRTMLPFSLLTVLSVRFSTYTETSMGYLFIFLIFCLARYTSIFSVCAQQYFTVFQCIITFTAQVIIIIGIGNTLGLPGSTACYCYETYGRCSQSITHPYTWCLLSRPRVRLVKLVERFIRITHLNKRRVNVCGGTAGRHTFIAISRYYGRWMAHKSGTGEHCIILYAMNTVKPISLIRCTRVGGGIVVVSRPSCDIRPFARFIIIFINHFVPGTSEQVNKRTSGERVTM